MSSILGVNVAPASYEEVVAKTLAWASGRESRALVFANVHVIMEAFDDPGLKSSLNQADIVNPDGVPLVWALKLLGNTEASRVYGPDCTLAMLRAAAERGVPVGLMGGTPETLAEFASVAERDNPGLQIVFASSPPFRDLSGEEDAALVRQIVDSGARILFICLGCPKQEKWMMRHYGEIPAVMFAVGAAIDFITGAKKQAPRWMMTSGLEWVFRLATEPRRLARRYLKNNPRFLFHFAWQYLSRS